MICEWEVEDIKPGRVISKPGIGEKWTIGFLAFINGKKRYVLISNLDGMVTKPETKEELAEHLTKSALIPIELLAD